jgi:Arc-like DNA binding domain
MVKKRKEETPHLRLRVGPEMLAKLEKARERNGRTLTGEIIHRLELSFARERNRATGFENAATILDLAADTLRPDLPPAEAQQHLRKVLDSLKRIASQLREEQERA